MDGSKDTNDASTLPGLLEVIGDLAEPLERSAVLERVGRAAARSIDSEVGFVGLLDGPDHLRLTGIHGGVTNSLETVRVERGRGLGGKVLDSGDPASVREYIQSDSISHEYDTQIAEEGLRGVLCIPLTIGSDVAGVAYVSDRIPKAYSDVMIERVLTAVESAKLALSLADRSRALIDQAVEAERVRASKVLGASVGEHLDHISAIAQSIAADSTSSPLLVQQATELLENAASASTALGHPIFGAPDLPTPKAASQSQLSRRELEVLQCAARGMSNPEIAAELYLARGTVKAYMEAVLRKLEVRNRVEAVMVAARAGLLTDL